MKAIVAQPPRKDSVRLAELPEPHPDNGEVLLQTLCVGIDGTDREISEGIYGVPPEGSDYLVLGHEAVARVHELGNDVEGLSKNDLVVPTVRRPCRENCLNCRNGETDKCLTGDYFEHGIFKLHGFASDYAVTNADDLTRIPSELEDVAVLLEPLSIAENAIAQSFRSRERIAWEPKNAFVAGAGPLGLLTLMILRLKGLEVYVAATRESESLKAKIVREIGGKYVNIHETPITTMNERFDIVVEATGKADVAIAALSSLGINGVMCFLGMYREQAVCQDFGKVLTTIVLGSKLMLGSVSSNREHFEMGINDMIEIRGRYGNVLDRLITHRLHPTEFRKAFDPQEDEIKTIICFRP